MPAAPSPSRALSGGPPRRPRGEHHQRVRIAPPRPPRGRQVGLKVHIHDGKAAAAAAAAATCRPPRVDAHEGDRVHGGGGRRRRVRRRRIGRVGGHHGGRYDRAVGRHGHGAAVGQHVAHVAAPPDGRQRPVGVGRHHPPTHLVRAGREDRQRDFLAGQERLDEVVAAEIVAGPAAATTAAPAAAAVVDIVASIAPPSSGGRPHRPHERGEGVDAGHPLGAPPSQRLDNRRQADARRRQPRLAQVVDVHGRRTGRRRVIAPPPPPRSPDVSSNAGGTGTPRAANTPRATHLSSNTSTAAGRWPTTRTCGAAASAASSGCPPHTLVLAHSTSAPAATAAATPSAVSGHTQSPSTRRRGAAVGVTTARTAGVRATAMSAPLSA
ncbi:hypothetical protein BU14_0320s0021 [Porphyra umbilicalis]|uniref:Uncharacterized protein n=1 Tax=Porphyra umbilicalis TaxID=2786 RepID=A0A1X6NZG7_PORUM|nr:hypothetical protein BU14_0320s0021 [Porphyra umbilicalis]|eukprot:OSX73910.1 hypothetical protein BU14_0320s0021 [Porphyra umbilicalis]